MNAYEFVNLAIQDLGQGGANRALDHTLGESEPRKELSIGLFASKLFKIKSGISSLGGGKVIEMSRLA